MQTRYLTEINLARSMGNRFLVGKRELLTFSCHLHVLKDFDMHAQEGGGDTKTERKNERNNNDIESIFSIFPIISHKVAKFQSDKFEVTIQRWLVRTSTSAPTSFPVEDARHARREIPRGFLSNGSALAPPGPSITSYACKLLIKSLYPLARFSRDFRLRGARSRARAHARETF